MFASTLVQGWCPVCGRYPGLSMGGMILLLVAVGLVVWLIRRNSGEAEPRAETPEDVLRLRYARREIDQAVYLRTLDDLRSGRAIT